MTATAPTRFPEPSDTKDRQMPTAPGLARLTRVELRKLVDTRAMIVTLAAAALVAGATGGGQTLRGTPSTLSDVITMALLFTPTFLVGIGSSLVSSEASHRTALTTYALVPQRGRVLAAKAGAMIALAAVAAVLAVVAGLLIGVVAPMVGGSEVSWTIDAAELATMGAGLLSSALIGWALGMATGSMALALTAFIVWPMVATLLAGISENVATVTAWLRPDAVYTLAQGVDATTVGQAATGLALWLVVPAVIGWMRLTKGEVR